jgi:hypothetical protein
MHWFSGKKYWDRRQFGDALSRRRTGWIQTVKNTYEWKKMNTRWYALFARINAIDKEKSSLMTEQTGEMIHENSDADLNSRPFFSYHSTPRLTLCSRKVFHDAPEKHIQYYQ